MDEQEDLQWLLDHGFVVAARNPALLGVIQPGLEQRARDTDAAYMIFDPSDDSQGYLLLGDDLPAMLREARTHHDAG